MLQWDRSQQKWATSMVASLVVLPMDIDRVQDAKGKGKRARRTIELAKVKMPKAKERKGKVIRKEGDGKGKGNDKDQKRKGVATCYTCGKPGHLAKDCWRNSIRHDRQKVSQPIHLQEEHH